MPVLLGVDGIIILVIINKLDLVQIHDIVMDVALKPNQFGSIVSGDVYLAVSGGRLRDACL